MPTTILLIHRRFPAGLAFIATAMAQRRARIAAIAERGAPGLAEVTQLSWHTDRAPTAAIAPEAAPIEADLIRARSVAVAARHLKDKGWTPDVIIGHGFDGEMLLVRDVFPEARLALDLSGLATLAKAEGGLPATARLIGVHAQLPFAHRMICANADDARCLPPSCRGRIALINPDGPRPAYEAAWLKLIAGLLGIPYSEVLYLERSPALAP